jgi:hypothetical protein
MIRKNGLLSMKLFALGIILALSSSCAESSKEKAENAYKEFEQVITNADTEGCIRLKEKCLAALDEAVREKKSELRALQARIGASANRDGGRDSVLVKAIKDLEEELANLSLKEDKVKSVKCENLNSADALPFAPPNPIEPFEIGRGEIDRVSMIARNKE